jgi:predicted glycosyltransferase
VSRIVFLIHTPGQVHLFKNAIVELKNRGHEIKLIVRDNGLTITLLDYYGFEYEIYLKTNRNKLFKLFQVPQVVFKEHFLAKKFKPGIIIGIGADESIAAFIGRKPCIIVNDSEPTLIQHLISRVLASAILTPSCFRKDLGRKQVRYAGYKELAYLHPDYFKPDVSIYNELGLSISDRYAVVRFNAFQAIHDIGKHGFTINEKIELVHQLEKYVKVFISTEGNLPPELKTFELPVSPARIHQVLYYAQFFLSDTGTMNTESAILGTPSITCLSNAKEFGNFIELEHKYGLIFAISEPSMAIAKAIELIQLPDLKEQWAKKRQKLLADKINVTKFMVNFIENYPESLNNYQASHAVNPFNGGLFT